MTKPTKRCMPSEDSDQPDAQGDQSLCCPSEKTLGPELSMERVFAGCTLILLVLSCRDSLVCFVV